MRWNEVTAVFGGAFDPPHLGHLRAAEGLLREPGVGRILILPLGASQSKPNLTPAEDRLALTRLNFASLLARGVAEIDEREIRRSRTRPDLPTYTADTLAELRQGGGQWAFVVGTDQVLQLDRWHGFPAVLALSHWILLDRKDRGSEAARGRLAGWVAGGLLREVNDRAWTVVRGESELIWARTEAPALSSTKIRESLAISGAAPAESLLPSVEACLKQRGLYGMKPSFS